MSLNISFFSTQQHYCTISTMNHVTVSYSFSVLVTITRNDLVPPIVQARQLLLGDDGLRSQHCLVN